MNDVNPTIREPFRAFRIHHDSGTIHAGLEMLTLDDLTAGDLVIESYYSSVNYKDAFHI